MLLPFYIVRCHSRYGFSFSACRLGKMGYCRSWRTLGYHEPILQEVLLQESAENIIEKVFLFTTNFKTKQT